jgi:hypothetical protein
VSALVYRQDAPPGTYDHRARTCASCCPADEVVLFFRAGKSSDLFRCTKCLRLEGEPRGGALKANTAALCEAVDATCEQYQLIRSENPDEPQRVVLSAALWERVLVARVRISKGDLEP